MAAIAALTVAAAAQERDRAKIPEQYKWNLADIYPNEAAWRAAKDKLAAELPQLRQFQGKLGSSAATLADALDTLYALDKELSRLYVYASMLADQDTRDATHQGMRQEMVQLAAAFAAEAAFIEPELLRAGKATLERFLASEPRLKIYRFYLEDIARRAAHTLSDDRGEDSRRRRPARGRAVRRLRHPVERRFPVPVGDAQRRPHRQARSGGVQRSARAAQSRRSREGDGGVLQGARRLQPHVRHDDERRGAEGAVLREGAEVPDRARDGARRPEHPGLRLHAPRRRREPQPAGLSPLPEAAQADAGPRRAALLRPVRAARRLGEARILAGGSAEARPRRGRAARPRVSGDDSARVQRAVDRPAAERGQALRRLLERRRLRRPPVHADQLQRQVHRREHARARARSHDAELLLEQDPALSAGRRIRSSSRKSRPRSTSRCSSTTC